MTYGRAPNAIDILKVLQLARPSTYMGPTFLWLFLETAPFQSPFTTHMGIQRTHSRLHPRVPTGSATDVLLTQSRFVKCVGGSACGLAPIKFYKPFWARSTSVTELTTNKSLEKWKFWLQITL